MPSERSQRRSWPNAERLPSHVVESQRRRASVIQAWSGRKRVSPELHSGTVITQKLSLIAGDHALYWCCFILVLLYIAAAAGGGTYSTTYLVLVRISYPQPIFIVPFTSYTLLHKKPLLSKRTHNTLIYERILEDEGWMNMIGNYTRRMKLTTRYYCIHLLRKDANLVVNSITLGPHLLVWYDKRQKRTMYENWILRRIITILNFHKRRPDTP